MVRHVSRPVAVGTTPTPIYAVSIGRVAVLKKILAFNSSASPVTITLLDKDGNAVSPPIVVPAGSNLVLGEQDTPGIDFYLQVVAIASASGVTLQIEVDEY